MENKTNYVVELEKWIAYFQAKRMTIDEVIEQYDTLAKSLRPKATSEGCTVSALMNPKLDALGQLRLRLA